MRKPAAYRKKFYIPEGSKPDESGGDDPWIVVTG
jgi:hypothetical protein